ncbi:amino acid adenylation domain-containing protein [Paenibacillus sp. GCM10027627]|uniref:amino acid adenylation domain-containing protein n=1 Tax=unclassified Paenibacillus TaxID=185978 RepID=UPI003641AEAA
MNHLACLEMDNIVDILASRTKRTPDKPVFTHLINYEESIEWTYRDLSNRASAIAAKLRQTCPDGGRAMLLYSTGLEFVGALYGCLLAGMTAVPFTPPDQAKYISKFQAVFHDLEPAVLLTDTKMAQKTSLDTITGGTVHILSTDQLDEEAIQFDSAEINSDSLALIQYTSGSTGLPKGVMVSHRNLVENQRAMLISFPHDEHSVIVNWLPYYHDMGLIGNLFHTVFAGAHCILMSPTQFIRKPLFWLQTIHKFKATTSGGPNFAYDLAATRTTPEELRGLDLSSWKWAYAGAETVRAKTLRTFAERFKECGFSPSAFKPCYGLAEATLFVSALASGRPLTEKRLDLPPETGGEFSDIVNCGTPIGCEVAIVDEEGKVVADGEAGEVWVRGTSVALGYWNKPGASEQTFQAKLKDGSGPYLRTGDLGFVKDDDLFISGRKKDIVIIRGRNLYPNDIEYSVQKTDSRLLGHLGAAFSVHTDEGEKLVVLQEIPRDAKEDAEAVVQKIEERIAEEYSVETYAILLVRSGSLPKTSSGKIQRNACAFAYKNELLQPIHSRISTGAAKAGAYELSDSERSLLLNASQPEQTKLILGHLIQMLSGHSKYASILLDSETPVHQLALDSLSSITLLNEMERAFHTRLPLYSLLGNDDSTLYDIAAQIADSMDGDQEAVEVSGSLNVQPLSYGQQALWLLQEMHPESSSYYIARAYRLRQNVDTDAFGRVVHKTLKNTILTSKIGKQNGEWIFEENEDAAAIFQLVDASGVPDSDLTRQIKERWNYPLLHMGSSLIQITLYKRTDTDYVLAFIVHHCVADFWSLTHLAGELGKMYEAETLGLFSIQKKQGKSYRDYVSWQNNWISGKSGELALDYWKSKLLPPSPLLHVPRDVQTEKEVLSEEDELIFSLDPAIVNGLNELREGTKHTFYSIFLTAFSILLHKYSGDSNLTIGTPTFGRNKAEFESMIGYFVNPVVLKVGIRQEDDFLTALKTVSKEVSESLGHSDYPLPLLVDKLNPSRSIGSSTPLFDILFTYQTTPYSEAGEHDSIAIDNSSHSLAIGPLKGINMPLHLESSRFNVDFTMTKASDSFIASLKFNRKLYRLDTMKRMTEHFVQLLQCLLRFPAKPLSEIDYMTSDERVLLQQWGKGNKVYSDNDTLIDLYRRNASAQIMQTSIVDRGEAWSYSKLNRTSNQVANLLESLKPDGLIGLMSDRNANAVVGMLAIMTTGNGFVPLAPSDPEARVKDIILECELEIVVTENRHLERLQNLARKYGFPKTVIALDEAAHLEEVQARLDSLSIRDRRHIEQEDESWKGEETSPDDTAYVLYTSGTTGKPKGVPITHRNLMPLFLWQEEHFGLGPSIKCLQTLSLTFDFGIQEVFTTLCFGGTLYFEDSMSLLNPTAYCDWLDKYEITMIYSTPSLFEGLVELNRPLSSIKVILLGGEKLSLSLASKTLNVCSPEVLFFNGYGPTEASINSTMHLINRQSIREYQSYSASVPIGTPSGNSEIWILDSFLKQVPAGIPGEIVIGGPGVAFGYKNREELNREKFLDLPGNGEGKLYRTGDMARFLFDGTIEYIGRTDHQVKMRGYRIETSEIESVLNVLSGVKESVVRLKGDGLVAYISTINDAEIGPETIVQHLSESIPKYMIPQKFYAVDRFPITSNGKVDTAILLNDDYPVKELFYSHLKHLPQSQIELAVSRVWSEVLSSDEAIDIYHNFFDAGGHSLLMHKVHSRLEEHFGFSIPIIKLFEHSTIHSLSLYLAEQGGSRPYKANGINASELDRRRQLLDWQKSQMKLRKGEGVQ